MSIQSNFPAIKPTLLLDFANTEQLDPRITFSRASTATYYGTQTAKAEENLLLQSQTFDNASWISLGITTTADTSAAPDGTTTADSINELATTEAHRCAQNVTLIVGQTYTVSVFVKPLNGREFQISFGASDVSGNPRANFNLTSGILGDVGSGLTATITASTNGFYRCTTTFVAADSALSVSFCAITTATAARQESYAGDVTKGIILWGAQLELRSAATAYTPTTTATITNYIPVLQTAASGVARFDHNPTTFESLGLLIEEQRTNLLTYSEQFDDAAWTKTRSSITANTVVAPDGTLTGDKLVEDTTASNSHVILQSIVFPASGTVTATIYAKAAERNFVLLSRGTLNSCGVNLTTGQIVGVSGTDTTATTQNVGNGWWRVSLVFPSPNITTTINIYPSLDGVFANRDYTGDGYSGIYIWGADLEAGAFPTSYIPTVASQVTRSADAASMTGTNFSSWYNQAEGTFFAQFRPMASDFGANKNIFLASDGTTSNFVGLRYASTGTQTALASTTSAVVQANVANGAIVAGTSYKLAGAYKANDFAASRDAGTVGTDTSGTVPVVTQAEIGMLAGSGFGTQTISKLAYYPVRIQNAQLQGLTS